MATRLISTICRFVARRVASTLLLSVGCGTCMGAPAQEPAHKGPTYQVDLAARAVMQLPAPSVQRYQSRGGDALAYRLFAPAAENSSPAIVAILVHGSGGSSLNMTVLGEALARAGIPAFAPDVRGQGQSGRRGDIDYIGQLDDDLTDLVAVVRGRYPSARLVLAGHSAGGGFALHIAGEAAGQAFAKFVLLAPVLGRLSPVGRPDAGWARANMPRIASLLVLNKVGITAFNGATTVDFNLPPDADSFGMTRSWSFRMMSNFGPSGQTQLFGEPGYRTDAARAVAPITIIVGGADEQFYADRYAAAFAGLPRQVEVEIADGVSHMGVVSDIRAVPLIVDAIKGVGGDTQR